MSDRTDSVEMHAGATHLPAEFREVARLANRAGIEGYEFVDAEVGLDLEKLAPEVARAWRRGDNKDEQINACFDCEDYGDMPGRILIKYVKTDIPAAPDLRDALERSLKLQAHYATLLNQWDSGRRHVFHSVEAWLANLEELRRLRFEASEEGGK